MGITTQDVQNLRTLESYMKEPRTAGDIANRLGVTKLRALDYIEIMALNPKRYRLECTDLAGPEKKWRLEG